MLLAIILIVLAIPALFVVGVLLQVIYGLFLGFRQDYFDRHPIR